MPLATVRMEHVVQEMMSLGLSPNEYAARWAHNIDCFSLDKHRYRDVVLQSWIRSLGVILFQKNGVPTLSEFRAELLADEEMQEIQEQQEYKI